MPIPLRTKESSASVRRSRAAHEALLAARSCSWLRLPCSHRARPLRRTFASSRATCRLRLHGRRSPRSAPLLFNMVGIHWQGSGQVWFRTAVEPGHFGPWRSAQPEADDAPDRGSEEADGRRAGRSAIRGGRRRHVGSQYRTTGRVTRLRTYFVDSPVTAADRARATAPTAAAAASAVAPGRPAVHRPPGGMERRRIDRPRCPVDRRRVFASQSSITPPARTVTRARSLRQSSAESSATTCSATAGTTSATTSSSTSTAASSRGGAAESTQNVIGAHAGGFNTGSVGVAVIGNYESASISRGRRDGAPEAARVAARRRPRLPTRPGRRGLGRQLDVAAGRARPPPCGLRPSRHESHELPGEENLRPAGSDRAEGDEDRPAEALDAGGRRRRRRARALHGSAFDGPPVDGRGQRRRGHDRRLGHRQRHRGRLDLGCEPPCPSRSTRTRSAPGPNVRPSTLPVPGPPPLTVTDLKASPRVVTPNGDWQR